MECQNNNKLQVENKPYHKKQLAALTDSMHKYPYQNQLFFPVNTFITKDFIIDPEDSEFILSDDNHSTYLGINSFI